jgi:hypothetical protein
MLLQLILRLASLPGFFRPNPGPPPLENIPGTHLEPMQQAYKEIGDWNTSVHESVDEKDRTVDVAVRFDAMP